MNQAHRELWQRIQDFPFDEGQPTLTFAGRLARENGWSAEFTRRVIEEYRRFLFLAVVAGHTVTPSDQVDQVWHLHLTYTRSYWDELCGKTLEMPLHHGPTRGGRSESDKFQDFYARTKLSYADHFGESPPADIWPDSKIRFGEDIRFERINRARNWVIPKPRLKPRLSRQLGLLSLIVILALFSGMNEVQTTVVSILFVLFALAWIGLVISGLVVAFYRHLNKKDGRDSGCSTSSWWGCGGDSSSSGGDCGDSGCGGDAGCGGGCGGCGGCGG